MYGLPGFICQGFHGKCSLGYRVYWWTALATNCTPVGSVTNAEIANLVGGTKYTFAVVSVDFTSLESEFSNQVIYTPPKLNIEVQIEHAGSVAGPWLAFTNVVFVGQAASNMQVFRAVIKTVP